MGTTSHAAPGEFSAELNDYLRKVLADHGREDLSGRWLEKMTESARRYPYWSKLVKNTASMTTNDIQVLSIAFGISPYEFVANARRWANSQPVPAVGANVGGHGEDWERSEFPEGERKIAAEEERNPKAK